ncbi:MAG: hypothetical protein HQL63_06315 [Magnetococcales bacterium]|nr:hypothetical protein [Magnetococcales bacterium]MBF0321955.1 hypothetical protein [Magnetococcales bacterium]
MPFENRVSSCDTLGDIFPALDPKAFRKCFVAWIDGLRRELQDVVAIEGRPLRAVATSSTVC